MAALDDTFRAVARFLYNLAEAADGDNAITTYKRAAASVAKQRLCDEAAAPGWRPRPRDSFWTRFYGIGPKAAAEIEEFVALQGGALEAPSHDRFLAYQAWAGGGGGGGRGRAATGDGAGGTDALLAEAWSMTFAGGADSSSAAAAAPPPPPPAARQRARLPPHLQLAKAGPKAPTAQQRGLAAAAAAAVSFAEADDGDDGGGYGNSSTRYDRDYGDSSRHHKGAKRLRSGGGGGGGRGSGGSVAHLSSGNHLEMEEHPGGRAGEAADRLAESWGLGGGGDASGGGGSGGVTVAAAAGGKFSGRLKSGDHTFSVGSGAYALVLALYRGVLARQGSMRKEPLVDAAQTFCREGTVMRPTESAKRAAGAAPGAAADYSGWSAMSTLVAKGFVERFSSPPQFVLTRPKGFAAGQLFHSVHEAAMAQLSNAKAQAASALLATAAGEEGEYGGGSSSSPLPNPERAWRGGSAPAVAVMARAPAPVPVPAPVPAPAPAAAAHTTSPSPPPSSSLGLQERAVLRELSRGTLSVDAAQARLAALRAAAAGGDGPVPIPQPSPAAAATAARQRQPPPSSGSAGGASSLATDRFAAAARVYTGAAGSGAPAAAAATAVVAAPLPLFKGAGVGRTGGGSKPPSPLDATGEPAARIRPPPQKQPVVAPPAAPSPPAHKQATRGVAVAIDLTGDDDEESDDDGHGGTGGAERTTNNSSSSPGTNKQLPPPSATKPPLRRDAAGVVDLVSSDDDDDGGGGGGGEFSAAQGSASAPSTVVATAPTARRPPRTSPTSAAAAAAASDAPSRGSSLKRLAQLTEVAATPVDPLHPCWHETTASPSGGAWYGRALSHSPPSQTSCAFAFASSFSSSSAVGTSSSSGSGGKRSFYSWPFGAGLPPPPLSAAASATGGGSGSSPSSASAAGAGGGLGAGGLLVPGLRVRYPPAGGASHATHQQQQQQPHCGHAPVPGLTVHLVVASNEKAEVKAAIRRAVDAAVAADPALQPRDGGSGGAAKVGVLEEPLPIGDFLWVATVPPFGGLRYASPAAGATPPPLAPPGSLCVLGYVCERKRVDDLVLSVASGKAGAVRNRYRRQKLELAACGLTRQLYLVEGDPAAEMYCGPAYRSAAICATAMAETAVGGMAVHETGDLAATAARLAALTVAIRAEAACRGDWGFAAHTLPAWRAHVGRLHGEWDAALPLWGAALAQHDRIPTGAEEAVLAAFPTPAALFDAYAAAGSEAARDALLRERCGGGAGGDGGDDDDSGDDGSGGGGGGGAAAARGPMGGARRRPSDAVSRAVKATVWGPG